MLAISAHGPSEGGIRLIEKEPSTGVYASPRPICENLDGIPFSRDRPPNTGHVCTYVPLSLSASLALVAQNAEDASDESSFGCFRLNETLLLYARRRPYSVSFVSLPQRT